MNVDAELRARLCTLLLDIVARKETGQRDYFACQVVFLEYAAAIHAAHALVDDVMTRDAFLDLAGLAYDAVAVDARGLGALIHTNGPEASQ